MKPLIRDINKEINNNNLKFTIMKQQQRQSHYQLKNQNDENYVIVRADRAGVFFGQLVKKEGNEVTLNNCRKLYYWSGACAVEELALNGVVNKEDCKFTVTVDNVTINNYLQIIPCSIEAIENIKSVKEWKSK